jgi:putative membrane protein
MKKRSSQNSIDRSREHLANERTFLAWIRTSIALMGFGFVIEKFSLFIKELSSMLEIDNPDTRLLSSIAGALMVVIGVVVAFVAFIKYRRQDKQLKNETFHTSPILLLFLTIILVTGGIFLAYYLLLSL